MTDTADHKVKPYSPSAEYRYFLYDPYDGHAFYRTPEERDAAAESLIKEYLSDDLWNEGVVDIYAGEVTHQVNEVERLERVGQLDDDGYDENGEYWGDSDIECKYNYALQPLAQPAPAEPVESVELTDQELLRTYAAAKYNYRYEGPIDDWPRNEERALTVAGLRAVIAADRASRSAPSAEGEAWEQVVWLRSLIGESVWFEPGSENASKLAHAAYVLLNQSDQIAELQRQLNRRTRPNA
jgi:hypothetical protein